MKDLCTMCATLSVELVSRNDMSKILFDAMLYIYEEDDEYILLSMECDDSE